MNVDILGAEDGLQTVTSSVSYVDLALAIADWVHNNLRTEGSVGRPADEEIVDNACESGPQIATAVLAGLGLLEALDDRNQRYRSTEPRERFRRVIANRQAQGPDYDILVLAAICLLQGDTVANDLRVLLTRVGVLHPGDAAGELRWSAEKAHYDSLYERWPELIENAEERR